MFNAFNQGGITGRNTTMNLNNPSDPVTITNLPDPATGDADEARGRRLWRRQHVSGSAKRAATDSVSVLKALTNTGSTALALAGSTGTGERQVRSALANGRFDGH